MPKIAQTPELQVFQPLALNHTGSLSKNFESHFENRGELLTTRHKHVKDENRQPGQLTAHQCFEEPRPRG